MIEAHAGIWAGVVAIGLYHGLNPAMGWPLAVANGLSARRGSAVFSTMLPLAVGHLAAMAVVLVPFAWLAWVVDWSRPIRLAAGVRSLAISRRWSPPRSRRKSERPRSHQRT